MMQKVTNTFQDVELIISIKTACIIGCFDEVVPSPLEEYLSCRALSAPGRV